MILLNPGPVNLSDRVRAALTAPDLCHREPEFAGLQEAIRRRLLEVYGLVEPLWSAVLLSGSGTAAVEAMLASLMPAAGRLLVLENGVYGARMAEIAACYDIPCRVLRRPWGEPFELDAVEQELAAGAGIRHVAAVHHETTTGRLNDLQALARCCRAHGAALLVDAVSSFGAEALELEDPAIAACAASANKCLHGAPGVSFVVLRGDALPALPSPRSVSLDLARHRRAQDAHTTAFTPAVPAFYALLEALEELEEGGGWRERHARYARLAGWVEEGLAALGVRPLLPDGARSVVLRAYHLPEGFGYATLHDAMKARGFVLYAGQGALADDVFRVSTMGAIQEADVERFLAAMGEVLAGAPERRV